MRTNGDKVRCFIAIELPPEVTAKIEGLQERLRAVTGPVKHLSWSRPEAIHLTIKFLGDIEHGRINDVIASLEESAKRVEPFELTLEKIGGFPTSRRPRVAWIGVKESAELSHIKARMEDELSVKGFARELRVFRPHLTICRAREVKASKMLARALFEVENGFSESMEVTDMVLFKSVLKPGGTEHTPLKKIIFT